MPEAARLFQVHLATVSRLMARRRSGSNPMEPKRQNEDRCQRKRLEEKQLQISPGFSASHSKTPAPTI